MEGSFPVGLMFGVLLSIPLWISAIGWIRLVYAAVGFLAQLQFA
ncbi:hypothetical protein O9H85_10120 [Paenibacillus filicis]|uniref:Uncharacterized protein n=1 Tax=Paenibacillus gyeongsangnamensis TaxID=3388067 RepID=A0ABT4Q7A8_9BACL|nr:hypothetical protein [Paenibacillus filicis]MCZ8512763.1 hypothetical protein [Paenibacillus filicis]